MFNDYYLGLKLPSNNVITSGEDVKHLAHQKKQQSPMGSAGGNINGAATVENSLTFPQKIKHRLISI